MSRPPSVVCVPLDVMMGIDFPPRRQLLSPWLFASSINMLTAYRGTGKTWTALSIALAAASGGQFLKFSAPEPCRVLYIDGEMAATEIQGRLRQLLPMFPDFNHDNFSLITPDLQGNALPDISTLKGQADLDDWTQRADLIVVDNLSSLARSGVENEAESWNAVATWALRMRREGRAVLFIHHTGKNGQQRGTSKREDLLDTSIILSRPEDTQEGASFTWEWSKVRGLHGAEIEPLRADLVTNAVGHLSWACQSVGDMKLEEVRQLRAEGRTVRQIAADLDISKSAAGRYVRQLERTTEDYRSASDGR